MFCRRLSNGAMDPSMLIHMWKLKRVEALELVLKVIGNPRAGSLEVERGFHILLVESFEPCRSTEYYILSFL